MKTIIYVLLALCVVAQAKDKVPKRNATDKQKALLIYKCELPPGMRQKVTGYDKMGEAHKIDYQEIYSKWHRIGWNALMERYSKHGDTKIELEPRAMQVPGGFGPMYQAMVIGHADAKVAIWKLEIVIGRKGTRELVTSALQKN